ncbi:MAG: HlyD family secretion protein [Myxococcota bacterium]
MSEPGPQADAQRSFRVRIAGATVGVVTLVGVVLASVHWMRDLRWRESTDDAYVEATLVLLSTRVGGHVLEVPVETNQHVHRGDVLVRLDPRDFEVRVERERANLDAARNRLASAAASAAAAEADRSAARVAREHAQREVARVRALQDRDVASAVALDDALAARDAARARERAAEQRAEAARAVLGNRAPVRLAEAALHEAELALSYATLVAPFDGVVGRKNVSLGQNVAAGQPLLALAQDEPRWVVANFKETQIGRMTVGDAAEVRVDAYPDRVWRGHIESLAPATGAKYALIPPDNATGNFTKVVQRVPVRIALDPPAPDTSNAPPALAVGLSVGVRVRVQHP